MPISRHLGRTASHRKSLLRNLVTDLINYESITTTQAKAKEAQRHAEWLISLAKNKSPSEKDAKIRAHDSIFKPNETLPKLFDDIALRNKNKNSGFTRVLKLEPRLGDNAPQSILELVGGKRDMRFALTARTVARLESQELPLDKITKKNMEGCIRSRSEEEFRQEVELMKKEFYSTEDSIENKPKEHVPAKKAPYKFKQNPLNA